jgi:hypothetical protein
MAKPLRPKEAEYSCPQGERVHPAVNQWISTSKILSDVIDFDEFRAVRKIHPSSALQQIRETGSETGRDRVMGAAIELLIVR